MSETLEERIRHTAKDDPEMGTTKAFASDLVEILDEKDTITNLLKSNPSIRLVNWSRPRKTIKLYWADDTHQWEVYLHDPNSRGLDFLYQGDSLKDALAALSNPEK
jgi:hypothetical protein